MRLHSGLLSLLLLPAACTGSTSPTTTEPGPVTSTSPATTVETPAIVIGGLIPADPVTLVPFENAEPLAVSWWHDGVVSPSGKWAAIRSGFEEAQTNQIGLIDLQSVQVVREDRGFGEGIYIDDQGQAVWFDEGELRGLSPEEEWPDLAFPGPVPRDLSDTLTIFGDGRIAYLRGPVDKLGPTTVVQISQPRSAEIVLDDVVAGPAPPIDPAMPSRDYIAPSVAWDKPRNRAFLVSSSDNTVHVVDLETRTSTPHSFEASAIPDDQGVGRQAYISPDGTTLMIATRTLTVTGAPDDWTAVDSAADLVIIDTTDWSSQAIEQSGWALISSPNRDHVATLGAEVTWDSNGGSNTVQSPVYLFDGRTGQPLVGFEGRSGAISDVQFSRDGAQMYVVSEGEQGTNIDIIDVATRQLAGSIGFTRISLVGEAGLLAFHTER